MRSSLTPRILAAVAVLSLSAATGCAWTEPAQQKYATPDEAVDALWDAVDARDRDALKEVLGPDADQLGTGDERRDKADFQRFAAALGRKRELAEREDGSRILLVGEDDFEFPAPIVRDGDKWKFDTLAGIGEMENRRIGANELAAIATCRDLVDAQSEYFEADPDGDGVKCYAARLRSSDGKRDGLWWPDADGAPESPLGPAMAEAESTGDIKTDASGVRSYRGYRFRVLSRCGAAAEGGAREFVDADGRMTAGFAFVAWPAEYDVTGIMTFVIGSDGVVYQCDLGDQTGSAAEMDCFDPGEGWVKVE